MAKVYIAGPMRGIPQFNFPAFDEATKLGQLLGWEVISPADLDRNSGFNEMENVEITADLIRRFVTRDIGALLSFRAEDGDAIALLPGWQKSTGAKAELAVAIWLGLAIVDARTFLRLTVEVQGVEHRPRVPAQFQVCANGTCGSIDMGTQTYAMRTIADRVANDPNWKP